jgi:hypothetical protein
MHGLPWAEYSFTPTIPPMTPWGKARYLAAKPSYGPRAADPSTDYVNPTTGKDPGCLPPGVPRIYIQPFLFEIVQTPGRVLELFEFDHHIRQIFTDGREHPKDPDHTWMGDSIGRYEGDALVVDTVSLNDKTWIDRGGFPIPTSCTSSNAFGVPTPARWRSNSQSTTQRHTRRVGRAIETSSCAPLGTSRNSSARTMPTTTKNSLTRAAHTLPRSHRRSRRSRQPLRSSAGCRARNQGE